MALSGRLLAHPTPEVRRAALHAAPWHPAAGLVAERLGRKAAPPEVHAAALLAGVAQGQREAWRACLDAPDAAGRLARLLVALSGERGEVARLAALLHRPALRADTLRALGFSGYVAAADACMPWLADDDAGALATEAFRALTGLVLAGRHVRAREETDADEAPPEETPSPLWPGPDTGLPVPVTAEVDLNGEAWRAEAWGHAQVHLTRALLEFERRMGSAPRLSPPDMRVVAASATASAGMLERVQEKGGRPRRTGAP